jgi:restriction system protein
MPESEALTKACPECGSALVERINRQNGSRFLGCRRWPECQHSEEVPAFWAMKRAGAQPLPGLEE